jgi:hypothetical protein
MAIKRSETAGPAEEFRSGRGAQALWWGIFAGPIGFALDEVLSYAIVQHTCSTGYHWLLHFYTLLGVVLALSGFAAARWCYRRLPESATTTGVMVESRSRFMAIYGIASSIAFTLVIIALSIPKWAMSPCDQ